MSEPLISVIMSVYNERRYLAKAVESILSQTIEDFEFIIIDDGSTDGSLEIIKKYLSQDKRIVLIRNEQNIGLTRSLNKGLAIAQGKYIARIDADDLSLPKRFAKQVNFLDAFPEIGVLGSWVQSIDKDGRFLGIIQYPSTAGFIAWSLFFYNPIAHPSVMIRKNVIIQAGGYNKNVRIAQDYDLWCRLRWITKLHNLPEALTCMRVHENNISSNNSARQVRLCIDTSIEMIQKTLGYRIPPATIFQLWKLAFERSAAWKDVREVFANYNNPITDKSVLVNNTISVARLIFSLTRIFLKKYSWSKDDQSRIRRDAARRLCLMITHENRNNPLLWKILIWAALLDIKFFTIRLIRAKWLRKVQNV